MNKPKLYRSLNDRMIGGVCGGLAVYLNIEATIVRLIFILLLFGTEIGFLLYLILWIVIPEEGKAYGFQEESFGDRVRSVGDDIQQAVSKPHPQSGVLVGVGLIVVGAVLFLERLDIQFLQWLDFDVLWPVLLIAGGIALLLRQTAKNEE
jgi:phage shock protein C